MHATITPSAMALAIAYVETVTPRDAHATALQLRALMRLSATEYRSAVTTAGAMRKRAHVVARRIDQVMRTVTVDQLSTPYLFMVAHTDTDAVSLSDASEATLTEQSMRRIESVRYMVLPSDHPYLIDALLRVHAAIDPRYWVVTPDGMSITVNPHIPEPTVRAVLGSSSYALNMPISNYAQSIAATTNNVIDELTQYTARFEAQSGAIERERRGAIRARFRANFQTSLREQNGRIAGTPSTPLSSEFPVTVADMFDAKDAAMLFSMNSAYRPEFPFNNIEQLERARGAIKSVRFGAWLNKRRATVTPATPANVYALTQSEIDHGTRSWGIEIEHVDADGVYAPRDWEEKDDSSLSAYSGDSGRSCECRGEFEAYVNNGWHEVECGQFGFECDCCSGNCDCESEDSGGCKEFVSPILYGVDDSGLESLMDDLSGRGSNHTAGIHVHVGAAEFVNDPKLAAAAAYAWALIDPILDPIYQREERNYCRPFSADEMREYAIKSSPKRGVTAPGERYPDRYRTLNLCALTAHGTLEFRAMGPVYDYAYLTRWAAIARAFVESIVTNPDTKRFQSAKTFSDVMAAINLTEFTTAN